LTKQWGSDTLVSDVTIDIPLLARSFPMPPTVRTFAAPADFAAVSDFLYTLYRPGNRDGNWFQPIWEYAYTHPWFDDAAVGHIGIWEDFGQIVGACLYELRLGEAFLQLHPDYTFLKPELVRYAEDNLAETRDNGRRRLQVYANDFDHELEHLLQRRGYGREPRNDRPMSQYVITDPFPPITLPAGFHLKSLADDNDLVKVDRALHRGFNHPGEPPDDGPAGRARMQSGPHFRKDLTMVVEAPDGQFVAFAGLWYEPVNRFGYVEPVATDPDYRRMGLGKAAVLEGIRRCGRLGATVAYVGSELPFYLAIGFKRLLSLHCWMKELES
jgi:GNAT superfamily N-acetyltransferase